MQQPDSKPRRKKNVSPRQLAANRANSLKSRGPKTLQGKLRSRFNSLQHGLTAVTTCIPGEDFERYDVYRHDYAAIFAPSNCFEAQLVDDLCSARWRKERAVRYETALMLEAVAKYQADIRKVHPGIDEPVETGVAFRCLSEDSNALHLLDRYEARLTNTAIRTWQHLMQVKASRAVSPDLDAVSAGPPAPFPEWPYAESRESIPENGHSDSQVVDSASGQEQKNG